MNNLKEVVGVGERRQGYGKTGKPFDFTPVYCTHELKGVKGVAAEEIMFSHVGEISFPNVSVGDRIEVVYDKRGFIQHVEVVSKTNNKEPLPKV